MTTDEKSDATTNSKTKETVTSDSVGKIAQDETADSIGIDESATVKNETGQRQLGDQTFSGKNRDEEAPEGNASKKEKLCNESSVDEEPTSDDVDMRTAGSVENLSSVASTSAIAEEEFSFKILYNKVNFDVRFGTSKTILQLKEHMKPLTGVDPKLQKLVLRGIATQDDKTLEESGIKNGVKLLLIGSTITDVLAVNSAKEEHIKEEKSNTPVKERWCRQKQHKKILDKGVPEDAMPAWKNGKATLPQEPLYGMMNKYGSKVRLTFKLEQDQLWVGTKERTDKLTMNNVRSVTSEPIDDHEEYHILAVQTGPTEASRIFIYWVPAQYIDAIKDTILGK